ncbi:YczE/YyaS/YitT family protein [Liquorilactobacillus vini]|nr:DUF6198 family protein [Liquorilactobacillus vini]
MLKKFTLFDLLRRYLWFMIGLFLNAIGVALITKANLGTSPIAAIPYSLSLVLPHFSLGQWTIIFSIFLIICQIFLDKWPLNWVQLGWQTIISFIFGDCIDWAMNCLKNLNPAFYWQALLYLLLGCLIIAGGAYLEVIADVVMLPGDAFVRAICHRWTSEYGPVRVCSDISMSLLGAIICLIWLHNLKGAREGTLISALLVGSLIKFLTKKLQPVTSWLLTGKFKIF